MRLAASRSLRALVVVAILLTPVAGLAAEPGALHGVIFDARGSAPVPGAEVRAGATTALTNADGAFRMPVAAGEHTVEVTAPGLPAARVEAVPVLQGRITELLVRLYPDGGEPAVSLEVATRAVLEQDAIEVALPAGPTGTLRLVVRAVEGGSAVRGARVFFRGLPVEGRTDRAGVAEVTLPVGATDLTVVHPKFSALTVSGVTVDEGAVTERTVELVPVALALADLDVVAPRVEGSALSLQQERQASAAVTDVVGAEEMAKAGASDAAAALKRVTGVTVVGGKYVYVRGLGDRYSSTLVNGATLPSPEPERRVVPLDMFPAEALESVVIQKTWSPDMPGEFGGGVVQLRTRGFPSALQAGVSLSTEVVLGTTFEDGPDYAGGPTDFLGIDGGFRAPPAVVLDASRAGTIELSNRFSSEGLTEQQLEELGEAMPNVWNLGSRMIPPGLGLGGRVGSSWEIGEGSRAGFMVALNYDNEWLKELSTERTMRLGKGGALEQINSYAFETLGNTITLAGILTGGVDLGEDHHIRLTTLIDRISDKEARRYVGFNSDALTDIRVDRLWWVERMLLTQQITGSHVVSPWGDLGLDWRYTFSRASRIEPDRRIVRYDFEPSLDRYLLSQLSEGNQRLFSELQDDNHDLGLDLAIPFEQWGGLSGRVKTGAAAVFKDRSVDTRRYTFKQAGPRSSNVEVLGQDPEAVFAPENIGPDGFQFAEATRPTDNYDAEQVIAAGYALAELPLVDGLRVVPGARVEWGRQRVTTFQPFSSTAAPSVSELDDLDLLPSVTLDWSPVDDMVVRLGYSRTIARPDFRELSEAAFNDVVGGRVYKGNPELERSVLHNVDARWEWYFAPGQSVSVAAFYKRFERPIETVIVPGAESVVSYANAEAADNLGFEIEARKSFDFISESLADLSLAVNATFVYSNVRVPPDGVQTSAERPLQGQSPWVVNAQLGWDDPDAGTSVSLLYNAFGPRIAEVGGIGAPDVYEETVHGLDLVARQALGAGFTLGASAKNLIDPEVRLTQGEETTSVLRKGRTFAISLGYSFQ